MKTKEIVVIGAGPYAEKTLGPTLRFVTGTWNVRSAAGRGNCGQESWRLAFRLSAESFSRRTGVGWLF